MKPATRGAADAAGTNVRGGASGSSWRFLLPSPRLGQTIVVGRASPRDLRVIAAAGGTGLVLRTRGLRSGLRALVRRGRWAPIARDLTSVADHEVETVVVLGDRGASAIGDPWIARAVEGAMATNAVAFVQGIADASGSSLLPADAFPGLARERLRIGTTGGDLRWASPAADAAAVDAARSLGSDPSGGVRGTAARFRRTARTRLGMEADAAELCARERPAGPPRYLRLVAAASGLAIEDRRWAMAIPGLYASNKAVFLLFPDDDDRPDIVVKVARAPEQNPRLENEESSLRALEVTAWGQAGSAPRVLFSGAHEEVRILGETAMRGDPFRRRTKAEPGCPYASAVIRRLIELGAETAKPADGSTLHVRLLELFDRYLGLYRPDARVSTYLRRQIDLVGNAGPISTVFQHGDPGTWNLLATPDGSVAFLDWEAGDAEGVPLWDLFYFLRSFGVTVGRASGVKGSLRAFERHYLERSDLARIQADAVTKACAVASVPRTLVEPLFHTCWMHRAVKQASRLPSWKLRRGHYHRLLSTAIDGRESPGLRLLFDGG
jgi:hypothetical protein